MKKKFIISAFILLGISIFATVLWRTNWTEVLDTLSQVTLWKLGAFLLVTSLSLTLMTWRWHIILTSHGHKVPFWKIWFYRMSGYGISYITPTQVGGEPARIYFLHENHGISLRESTSSVLLDKLIEISAFVIFVASGVVFVSFTNLLPQETTTPLLGVLLFLTVVLGYVFKKILDGTGFLTMLFKNLGFARIKRFQTFEEKILKTEMLIKDFLSHTDHKTRTLPFIAFISLLAWSCTVIEYALILSFLGIPLSGSEIFLVATVPLIAYVLPVPGGLGALEGAQMTLFSLLGYSTSLALAVVIMVRVKEIFFSAIGFAYALTHGLTLLGQKKEEVKAKKALKKAQRKMKRQQRSMRKKARQEKKKSAVQL